MICEFDLLNFYKRHGLMDCRYQFLAIFGIKNKKKYQSSGGGGT